MKKIEATMDPVKLDEVKSALGEIGIEEMTISEVRAVGRQKSQTEVFRGTEFHTDFLPEIKIELILPDNQMDAAVAAITKGTKTSPRSSGKVFVSNIDNAFQQRAAAMAG